MIDLASALALAIVIEGILYALFPNGMKRMMASIFEMPSSNLRGAGLIAAVLGVGLIWLIRR
jgi:hypothetical protein